MFKDIFESSPLALILVDIQGKMKFVNREAQILFGYTLSEMEGQPIEILVPQEIRGHHPNLRADFFRAPSSRSMGRGRNLFGVKKDGTKFPIEVGLNPINSPEGRYVVSSIIDITARVKAEEKFRTAVEAAPNGMIMVDSQRKIVLVNEQIEKLFGYSRNELLGNAIETLVPLEFRDRHPVYTDSYMKSPSPRAMGAGRDLFARKKDGTKFPVEIGLRPYHGPDGLFVISSVVDITERIKDREKLMARNEELQQFAYRTSHDLKAPLISIQGLAEYIIEDIQEKNNSEVESNAKKIVTLSQKLALLLEDILILTKSDYINEDRKEIFLSDIVETAKQKFEISATQNGVSIEQLFAHTKPLLSQPTVITQIIDNLISNGIKYADPKKERRFVSVKTFNDSSSFHIQIVDNGLGIPLEKHSEVFGMFKRFHLDKVQGSGLGLYLVKKHVQKLGGTLSFESSDQGTIFYIVLPL
jgi:PAS domain S-box-containing protein